MSATDAQLKVARDVRHPCQRMAPWDGVERLGVGNLYMTAEPVAFRANNLLNP